MRAIGKFLLFSIVVTACGCMLPAKKDSSVKKNVLPTVKTSPQKVVKSSTADQNKELDKLVAKVKHEKKVNGKTNQVFKEMNEQKKLDKNIAADFLNRGNRLFDASKYEEAVSMYKNALEKDPNLFAAREKLNQCESILGKRKASINQVMNEMIELRTAEQQSRLHDIERAIDQSIQEMKALRFKNSEFLLQEAQARLALLPSTLETKQTRSRIENLLVEVKADIRSNENRTHKEQEAEVQKTIERDAAFRKQLTEEKIKMLLERAQEAYQLQDYKQCMQITQTILLDRPRQLEAIALLKNAMKQEGIRWKERIESQDKEEKISAIEGVDEGSIPYSDPFTFPEKKYWTERVQHRSGEITLGEMEDSMEVKAIKNILNTTKINLNFNDKPLSDVVDFIKTVARINIHIDKDVDAEETKVSLNLKNIKLSDALEHIMINTGLAYTFKNNLLEITVKEKAKGRFIFKIYNVTDILSRIRDFPGPELKISSPDEQNENMEGNGGAGGVGNFNFVETEEATTLSSEQLQQLIEDSTGGSEVWGTDMKIEPCRGQLLITATPELHQKVKKVLEELRRDSDLFVVVRARFIDIYDDFLEDIGIDYRNLGQRDTPWNDKFNGRIHDSRTGGQDVGFTQSIKNTSDPELIGRMQHMLDGFSSLIRGERVFGGPGGLSGLSLQFMLVDPYQINAILRAVQENSGVRSVIAPEVTAHNGQRVFVSVITQRSYIADYELVSGGTTYTLTEVADPIVEVNEEGVVLDVRPTISADRKYITVDVKPTLATLIGGVISTVLINLGTVMAAAMQVPIGLPKMSIQRTWTSVTVPNGGTVLLGGFRSLNHKKFVSSIPILGKIPLLNLLVSRKSEVKEKRSLIILLTAQLVDLRKEEAQRFGK